MDVFDEFKKYCEENPDNLRAEVMSGREMARRAFFYAWAAAQQSAHPTPPSTEIILDSGVAYAKRMSKRARKAAGG